MDPFSPILKSSCYFGEISEEETKNILMRESPHSYLYRRLKNGSFTIATIQEFLGEKELIETVVKTSYYPFYNAISKTLPKDQKEMIFQNHERFLNFRDFFEKLKPIKRKNPLPLEEMAKSYVAKTYKNFLDQLELPKIVKEEVKNLTTFEKESNEKNENQLPWIDGVGLVVVYHYDGSKEENSCSSILVSLEDNKIIPILETVEQEDLLYVAEN